MATKKATKKVAKFPDTLYVTRDQWVDAGTEYFLADKTIEGCASETTTRVGVYQLVGEKNVTKVTEVKVEDVNG